MRKLVIDQYGKECIEILKEYANKYELSLQDIKDTIAGIKAPVGNNPKHVCTLYDGYRIVYSIENQPNGKVRHISISNDDKSINGDALKLIINEFGFDDITNGKTHVYIELGLAINVIQLM